MTQAQTGDVHLSLLDNSHAFLREAAHKAARAFTDPRQWQFAIVSLVQSLELSLKALLHQIHPVFVYESVDTQKNTVTLSQAMSRLESKHIGKIVFSDQEKHQITRAVALRNQMTHSEFELKTEFATAKFLELFAYIVFFQARHFGQEVEDIVDADDLSQVHAADAALDMLALRAIERINEEDIDPEWVWECPACSNDTFVVQDDQNVCFTCRHAEDASECPQCDKFFFTRDIQSFEKELRNYGEGYGAEYGYTFIYRKHNYTKHTACPQCKQKIVKELQKDYEEEEEERYADLMREGYYDSVPNEWD